MRHYHPTRLDDPQTVIQFEPKAAKQDESILSHLSHHPDQEYTAYELELSFQGRMLITSIRRALTNLFQAGKIIETGYRKERWGKRNTTYKINLTK